MKDEEHHIDFLELQLDLVRKLGVQLYAQAPHRQAGRRRRSLNAAAPQSTRSTLYPDTKGALAGATLALRQRCGIVRIGDAGVFFAEKPMSFAATLSRFRIPTVVALGLLLAGCGVNNIPTFEEQAKAKWADVQNQYQRRADLIPNLVETVKGYAKQEREMLTRWSRRAPRRRRSRSTPDIVTDPAKFKQFQEAQDQLSGALGRLIAVSRELSRPQVEPELPRAAVAARRHREPHRGRAARLHRGGARLQHRAAHLPGRALGDDALSRPQADGDVHGRRRRRAARRRP